MTFCHRQFWHQLSKAKYSHSLLGVDFGPRGIWQHGQIFSVVTTGEKEDAPGRHLMGRVGDANKHLTMHRIDPPTPLQQRIHYLAQCQLCQG